jgi:hypothetical protein
VPSRHEEKAFPPAHPSGREVGPVETGITLPFKFSSINDPLHTDAYNVGLDPHGSYTIVGKRKRDWAIGAVGGAFLNSLVFTADAIDLTGYLRYGGFVGGKGRVTIGPVIVVGRGAAGPSLIHTGTHADSCTTRSHLVVLAS